MREQSKAASGDADDDDVIVAVAADDDDDGGVEFLEASVSSSHTLAWAEPLLRDYVKVSSASAAPLVTPLFTSIFTPLPHICERLYRASATPRELTLQPPAHGSAKGRAQLGRALG